MSSNTNLFYSLYSNSNNTVESGYRCKSAIDEADTSFDITASANGGSVGVITDSNGNTLASIPMDQIHAAGITQYNVETRILQPWSCCLLQGQEYGLACASYYYVIPKPLQDLGNKYEAYISCDFDIIYNNFTPYKFHIHTEADGEHSFVDLINDELENNNVQVSVSLQTLPDPIDNKTYEYLVFLSQAEGYFYYINNLRITLAFQNEDNPESPFSKALSGLKNIIYDFIEQFHPMQFDPETGKTPKYDEDTYEVDCELYKWLLVNYQEATINLKNFKEAIKYLQLAEKATTEAEADYYIELANGKLANTPFDDEIFNNYDPDNLEIIYNIIESLKAFIDEAKDYYQDFYWLIEDRHRRIPLMKYPNGAFRGIVVIPDWPTNQNTPGVRDFSYASLWVNHIKNQVKLYRPTKEHQFLPKIYGVLANATIMAEEKVYKETDPHFNGFQCNCSCCHDIPNGWNDTLDTDYVDPYRPQHSVYEDTVYMGQNCYAHKKNIIGLFRYMQYVNDEKLWNKVGQAYMIIGNPDDPQSKDKNLPQSLLIYNPNPEPIRIKYLIFS